MKLPKWRGEQGDSFRLILPPAFRSDLSRVSLDPGKWGSLGRTLSIWCSIFNTVIYPSFWAFSPKLFCSSIQKRGIIYSVCLRGNGAHILPLEQLLFKLFFAFRGLAQLMAPTAQAVQLPITYPLKTGHRVSCKSQMPGKQGRPWTRKENEVRKGKFTQAPFFSVCCARNGWLTKCTEKHEIVFMGTLVKSWAKALPTSPVPKPCTDQPLPTSGKGKRLWRRE